MKRIFRVSLAVTLLASFLSANPDPLAILRGEIPKSFSSKHKKRTTKRIVRKRVIKRKVVRRVKKRTSHARSSRIKWIKREYLGPTKKILLSSINYKIYSRHKLTGNPYLDMKAIDGPMPNEYASLYLKSKTLSNPVKPYLKIVIDKSVQRMYVYKDFKHIYTFKVSTGKAGHRTPSGVFKPYSVEEMHYSRKYYNAPMPWSVFFNGGVAIHGTSSLSRLGTPASHGCVRTYPRSARRIYELVRKYGKENTTIIVRD